ncbi:hypothetical protein ACVWZR_007053 [Bradyrhizobium sp. i1.3.1]
MSTAISTLGGVGLFLLGMTVMTEGLKTLAGSALRGVLGKAASTPLLGLILGSHRHAAGAVLQRDDDDDDRSCQRRPADVPARVEPGLRREYRHHGDRLAGRADRRPCLANGRGVADDLRRRVDQASRPRASFRRRCRARGIWTRAVRADDPAAGHGRAGGTFAPGGPARGPRQSRDVMVVGPARRAGARGDRIGHDRADAIVDGRHRSDLVRLFSQAQSGWTRPAR